MIKLSHTLQAAFFATSLALANLATAAAAPDPAAASLHAQIAQVGLAAFTAADYKPGVVHHVVMIRFKSGVDQAKRASIIEQFMAMQKSAVRDGRHYIVSAETGPQISGEGASHGLEQAFIFTFASQGDRNYFIGTPVVNDPKYYEPVHAAFKKVLIPTLAKNGLVSFDFPVTAESKNP